MQKNIYLQVMNLNINHKLKIFKKAQAFFFIKSMFFYLLVYFIYVIIIKGEIYVQK